MSNAVYEAAHRDAARAKHAAIVVWFEANPGAELDIADLAAKFDLTLRRAYYAVARLRPKYGRKLIRVVDRRTYTKAEQAATCEAAP